MIVDEAHQVQFDASANGYESLRLGENRSAKLEQFAARLFTNAPDCPAVALSAVAGGAEQAIAQWISRDTKSQPHRQNYRSTRQLIGRLDCSASGATTIRLELVDGKPLYLAGRVSEAYIPSPFSPLPTTKGALRTDLTRFIRCHSLWAAIQLAISGRTVLISITREIDRVICDFCEAIDQESWREKGSAFFVPPALGEVRYGVDQGKLYRDCLNACREYCGPTSYEAKLLEQGIAVHHGQLPVRVRRLMTNVIQFNVVPIAVATSTLTEGVNMPFDVIILPAITRRQRLSPDKYEYATIPVTEFLNLAGRAGRPGASVEGMTLVALAVDPTSRSGTNAYNQQMGRVRLDENRFIELINNISAETIPGPSASSPISHLLHALWESWVFLSPSEPADQFLRWLEETNPASLPAVDTRWAELADTLDSLDLLLVSAIEEAENLKQSILEGAELEAYIRLLWSHTYARFAAREVDLLERIFVTRAVAARTTIYPDKAERKRIYQLGLPPRRSTNFLTIATAIEEKLREASEFGNWSKDRRLDYLVQIGDLLQDYPAFRLRDARPRQRRPGASWHSILRWWLRAPGAIPPDASIVRDWLFVATTDFEFRLGSAINSTISIVWDNAHKGEKVVPTLEEWREATELPWAVFWLRDMLAWGTLEPVVAYLMSVSSSSTMITTRENAERFIQVYYDWYIRKFPENESPDEFFNPLHLSEWQRSTFEHDIRVGRLDPEPCDAVLRRRFPANSLETYSVLPCELEDRIAWLDAAGYWLADSEIPSSWNRRNIKKNDYYLDIYNSQVIPKSV